MTGQQRSDLVGVGRWVLGVAFAVVGTAFWLVPLVLFHAASALDKGVAVLFWFCAFGVLDFPVLHDFLGAVGDLGVKLKDVLIAAITRKPPGGAS